MERFSVIIPWRRRPEIARTVAANAALFARHAMDVILVNVGGEPEELAHVVAGCPQVPLQQIVLPSPTFNKCLAHNVGAFMSSAPLLFFLDADIVLTMDVFSEAARMLREQEAFVQIRRVHESHPRVDPRLAFLHEQVDTRELSCAGGRRATVQFFAWGDSSRCGSGLLLMKREHFLAAGGYNAALTGWGFEDVDLQLRLQFVSQLTPIAAGEATHLSHGDEARNIRVSRPADEGANMMHCFENYSREQFMGTYAQDVAAWRDRIRAHPSSAVRATTPAR